MKDKFIQIAKLINDMTSITARVYEGQSRVAVYCSDPQLEDKIDSFGPFFDRLNDQTTPIGCITTPNKFCFGFINGQDLHLVLGPVRETRADERTLECIALRLDPTGETKDRIINNMLTCPQLSVYSLLPLLGYSYRMLNFDNVTAEGQVYFGMETLLTDIKFYEGSSVDYTTLEQSIDLIFLKLIEEGKPDAIKEWHTTSPFSFLDTNITSDTLRNYKDHFIINATLYSVAAVRGGIDKMSALKLLVYMVDKVEAAENELAITELQFSMAHNLAKRVSLLRKTPVHSKLVEDAIRYIQRGVYETLRAEDIAKALYVSRSHLSKTFHKETGKTIHEYMLDLKIHEATILLTNPDNTISFISDVLGFSSQSYFTKVFKNLTGMTPRQYQQQLIL